MHPRRMTVLALAALLTSGCVAVPHTPAPAPAAPPAGLAPAADRPPVPLPTWPRLAPAAPREELTATDPRPTTAKTPAPKAARPADRPRAQPGTAVTQRRVQLRKRQGTGTVKTKKVTKPSKRAKRTAPKVLAPKKKRPSVQRQQPAGAPADMRQLCREAGRINAPMGAADLCRSTYGR